MPARSILRTSRSAQVMEMKPVQPDRRARPLAALQVGTERLVVPVENQIAAIGAVLGLPTQPFDHVAVDRQRARLLAFRLRLISCASRSTCAHRSGRPPPADT
jgi:hypothetical protein